MRYMCIITTTITNDRTTNVVENSALISVETFYNIQFARRCSSKFITTTVVRLSVSRNGSGSVPVHFMFIPQVLRFEEEEKYKISFNPKQNCTWSLSVYNSNRRKRCTRVVCVCSLVMKNWGTESDEIELKALASSWVRAAAASIRWICEVGRLLRGFSGDKHEAFIRLILILLLHAPKMAFVSRCSSNVSLMASATTSLYSNLFDCQIQICAIKGWQICTQVVALFHFIRTNATHMSTDQLRLPNGMHDLSDCATRKFPFLIVRNNCFGFYQCLPLPSLIVLYCVHTRLSHRQIMNTNVKNLLKFRNGIFDLYGNLLLLKGNFYFIHLRPN